MKLLHRSNILFYVFLIIFTTTSCTIAQDNETSNESNSINKVYYAIEINDAVCGYSESSEMPFAKEGKDLIEQHVNIFLMLSLLGSEFNTEMDSKAVIDPITRKASSVSTNIKQGSTDITIEMNVNGNKATIKSPMSTQPKEIDITAETVIGSDEMFARLKREFYEEEKTETELSILELMEGEIQKSKFKKTGEETV